ncbi:myosin-M heavy chain [Trichonephila clavata]|uniref:Myosin-M heavy chain n=1 Tax=Trichonephila clavata TaxID=2740835 RepID=A0A8X6GU27_TRICU|nr:myosin-M heavy chain [Trichonephila clavata]
MEGIRYQAETSISRNRDLIMEDRYRRLHYEGAPAPYWTQTPPKAVALTRFKRHLPAIPKKKNKESSKKAEQFDIPPYAKHYKDKYGSVSAHSTSAIYGALRAPHYHAIYGPSNMWYASVRSLNRGCPREVMYPPEAYEWRETLYEDVSKEVFPVPPPVEIIPGPPCACMVRRRPGHEGSSSSHVKSSRQPRCKYCTPVYPANGSSNGGLPMKQSMNPEKMKSPLVADDNVDMKPEAASRMSGYKKCVSGSTKYKNPIFKGSMKDSGAISRKSILECDVTAYDLIKKVAKTPSISEIDDSDIDDNLSDNAVAKTNKARWLKLQNKSKISPVGGSPRQIANKKLANKFKKSQSDNSIYNDSHSVLVGGQRIFTDNNRSKSPDLDIACHPSDDLMDDSRDSGRSRWRNLSVSDESICIPDPDYDYSDDSDEGTVVSSRYRDPKFTYSPPPIRKSSSSPRNGLGYVTREISKSMSSLLSDDTYVPSININNSFSMSESVAMPPDCDSYNKIRQEDIFDENDPYIDCRYESDYRPSIPNVNSMNSKHDSKYESSSDCSSSGGTLSSEYPTWTSSSSNELKSILKKKKRRDNAIQEPEDASRVFRNSKESKDSQRKKQVQFLPGCDEAFFDSISVQDIEPEFAKGIDNASFIESEDDRGEAQSVINQDTYETVSEVTDNITEQEDSKYDCIGNKENARPNINPSISEAKATTSNEQNRNTISPRTVNNDDISAHSANPLKLPPADVPPSLPPTSPPKLPVRSSSLEDVRDRISEGNASLLELKDKTHRRRRRTTLPKRRFSDLHLHILLCPKSPFCGDGSSSDDVPLTASSQRAHRSLPDSPSELDEVSSFCFDFLEKGSKEKVLSSSRSIFYVSVDANEQTKVPESNNDSSNHTNSNSKLEPQTSPVVSPSIEKNCNPSTENEDSADNCDLDENLSPDQYDTDEDILENDYENLDPIYEELSDVSNSSKRLTSLESNQKSFFEGASKIDILSYLEDAKERGISEGLSEDEKVIIEEEDDEQKVLSGEEDDVGEKNRVIVNNNFNHKEVLLKIEEDAEKEENVEIENTAADVSKSPRISEVERNDSGVGTETSKPARMKQLPTDWEEQLCADCDHQVEPVEDEDSGLLFSPLVCRKCEFRRCERKEIIIEFVDTELKYGRDLRIIKEEFYRPMEIAGLLAKDQLLSIFLNLDELISANTKFAEKLQDALDIAMEHGDEDYTTVNLGKIFLETSSMLHAFETYCVKQAPASVLLSSLEKEKELLRIFLRVSQMENTLLRRMNLPAFLMVPVQRVTRYPLLLSRLHKVTPIHHKDRNALKEAQQKVELHLEHINQQTKGVGGTKIWRRISNISASHRRLGKDIGSIKLRKMALEVLNWKQDETRFVMAGKLMFTQITDYPWNKKGKTVKFAPVHALLIALGKPNSNYRPESSSVDNPVLFPKNTGIRDASLVLMKEKNGRFVVVRDPLYLGNCVISCDSENEDVFEIQEYTTKEAYLLKGETKKDTKEWLRQLRYHAKDLGSWRKRRNALANIMINGMIRQ